MWRKAKVMDQTAAGQGTISKVFTGVSIKKKSRVPGVMITQFVEEIPEGKSTPDFTRKPIAMTIQEGKLAFFKAVITGHPTPDVTWKRAKGDLLDPEKFRTKYDQKTGEYSLEIMTVRGEDADTYKCFALNEFGKAVCTATLNVIEVGFKRHKAKEETDSALNSNPAEFRKMLRTRAGVEKCEKKEETIDAKFWELLLSADRKDYERLCAEYGVTDFRWMLKKLNEMKKKKEEDNLKHIEVKGDGTASFELDLVLKDPSSRIFLYKDGDMIPFSEDMEMKHQLKQVGKKLVFTIKDLLPEDAGVYQVDVEDVNVFSTEFKIPTVDFLVKIKEVKAKEREDALFECVLSHPLPMIIWIGKNSVLEAGEKYEISVSEDKLVHRLLVRDCMQLDRGIYTAVAGIRSSSAWLVVDADTDPRMNGKKKVRKTTQAGGSGVDLEAVAQEQLAKLLKEKEETKWLKEKEEAKLLKEKTEAKWLNGMEEAKWLNGKEEAKWLNGKEEAKWLNGMEEAKWLNRNEEAKWLNGKEEAKWLNGMEEAKWLNGKEEAKWLNGKEEAKWLNGMEEAKWLNRNEEAKWLKKMGEARLLKEKEEAKLLKENKEAKQLKGKEEAKLLKEKVEAKWLREKEEAILLKEKEGARLIKEKEEANWLKGKEEAKLMKEKEEAKLLKGMEETTWLKGLEETTLLKEKEEAKLMKEEVKLLKGMEEPKLLKDKAEEKLLEKKETTRPNPPRFNPDDLEKFSGPVIVKAGQNATFKIPFLGQDPARVQWYREGVELLENPNIKLEKMANQSRLLLRKCQRKDTGEIKVKIKNEFGTAEAISRLIVLDKPSPPQGPVEVLESSATCIEIKWRPPKDNGGSSVMSYTLERQQIGRNTWKKLGDVEPVPRYKDTDVDHGRKYCYHIWAVNREGVSDMMETEDVMAGTKAFPGLPAAPKIVSAFKDCINLSWTPPTKTGGSRIVGYNLEKRKKGSNLWTPVNPAKEPIQEKTYAVGDVVAGMEYEFRVAAINLSGVGEPSLPSESVFARDPKKCPGKVSDLKVTDSTFAILSLSWSKPAVEEGVQDEAKGYFVEIRPGDSLAWERCNANPASLTFFTVKGLRSMAMYWVRVIATNEGGEGQPQDLDNYILAMPPTVRPKITRNLKTFMAVKAGNSVRVNINFVASPMPDVIWLKDNVPVTKRVTISNSEGTSQLFIPTSERSDSGLYTIIIRNLVGQETFSVEIRVTDDPKPPGVVELEEKVPGTVTVSWEPSPDEKRDDRLHYMVSRRDSSKKTWSTIADRLFNNKFTACNIMPGCEYHFRVYAKNDMGVSEPSDSPTWGTARKREKFVVSMPVYKAHDLRRAPSFLVPLKTHTAPPGYECYMSCAVGGNPAPRITWLRNNVSLNADANYYISNTCGVCSLLILRVGPHDTGEYTVMAENRLGRAHCSTWLTITD
nr:immunoglobulin-like and fibronectin type III domain-containing protein 1 [Paramormyrops kingsleyae]